MSHNLADVCWEDVHKKLLRFAMLQLRDPHVAEDCVQEVLLIAMEKHSQFSGQSSFQTWLTGILKYKVLDYFRAQAKQVHIPETEEDTWLDDLFDEQGHFVTAPNEWQDPSMTLENKAFMDIFEDCLSKLPKATSQLFMMRTWMDIGTDECCKVLQLSSSNAWVMLYRARMKLKECVELNWFGEQQKA